MSFDTGEYDTDQQLLLQYATVVQINWLLSTKAAAVVLTLGFCSG